MHIGKILTSADMVMSKAYTDARWASNPVVRVAQQETTVDMPPELDIPWAYLQRLVGCYADSGNHTTNVLLSFDASGHRRLRTTFGIDQSIMSTEDNFFSLFYNWETNVIPPTFCHLSI